MPGKLFNFYASLGNPSELSLSLLSATACARHSSQPTPLFLQLLVQRENFIGSLPEKSESTCRVRVGLKALVDARLRVLYEKLQNGQIADEIQHKLHRGYTRRMFGFNSSEYERHPLSRSCRQDLQPFAVIVAAVDEVEVCRCAGCRP